MSVLHPN